MQLACCKARALRPHITFFSMQVHCLLWTGLGRLSRVGLGLRVNSDLDTACKRAADRDESLRWEKQVERWLRSWVDGVREELDGNAAADIVSCAN